LRITEVAFAGALMPPSCKVTLPPGPRGPPLFLVSSTRNGGRDVYTVGGRNWNLSPAEAALVPLNVVTVTSTVPAASAGLTAVICESETKVKLVAAGAPNLTAVAPVNPHPVMVTVVPPAVDPEAGITEFTVGAPPTPRLHTPNGPTVNDHVYGIPLTVSATVYVTPF
jgi:hypothetical protein